MIILRKFILFSLLALGSLPLRAQELFPNLLTPGFRGDSGTEYTGWNIFTEPYLGLNHGDVAAAASNPTLVQNLTSTAFLTSGFNIYSFSAATGFEIANNTSGTIGALGTVVFQFDALGTFLDYSTIKLNYSGGSISLNPTSIISESRVISGGFGGYTNRAAMQWNLTGLGITDYTISFQSLGSSTSFNSASLDTSTTNSEVVPLARTFAAGGSTANWSETANWSTGVIPSAGANVKVTAGSSLIADAANEVGQLTFSQSGSFALTGANTLTINTGITLAAAAGAVTVDAPIRGGGHLFLTAAEATTLTIQGDVSGAPAAGAFPAVGLTKEGKGTVAIVGDINFAGGVAVEAGTLRLSGNNTYGGPPPCSLVVLKSPPTLPLRRRVPSATPAPRSPSVPIPALSGPWLRPSLLLMAIIPWVAMFPWPVARMPRFWERPTPLARLFSPEILLWLPAPPIAACEPTVSVIPFVFLEISAEVPLPIPW